MFNRGQKEKIVGDLAAALRTANGNALFVDYRGVNTHGMLALREKLAELGGKLRVVRKTLFRRAWASTDMPELRKDILEGQVAVAYGFSDAPAAAKIFYDFRKTLETEKGPDVAFQILGGVLEMHVIDAKEAKSLAMIPPRPVLLAWLVATMAAPLRGFVTVLSGSQRDFVRVLQQKVEKVSS